MSTKKVLREVTRCATALGLTVKEVSKNKHIKLHLTRPDGTWTTYVVPVSGRGGRAERNVFADLRRIARGPV